RRRGRKTIAISLLLLSDAELRQRATVRLPRHVYEVAACECGRLCFGRAAPARLPAADHAGDVEDDRLGPDGGIESGRIGVAELRGEPVRSRPHVDVGNVLVAEVVAERVAVEV